MTTLNLRNPNGYDGSPGTQYKQGIVRLATNTEATAGTSTNVVVTPAQMAAAVAGGVGANFASPPVLGFGSTTPRPVHATTLDSTSLTSLATAPGAVLNLGNTTGSIGFFGATAVVKPTSTTDLRTALINLGLYTTGGASPLNLNGGALTAGATTATTLGSTGNTSLATGAGVTAALGNSTGTLGFFGSSGATRVSQAAITNSVTAGGTTGTIANFTDLSTYATDAPTIRNDIYQLSLALANVIAAMRSYGLLA